MKSKSTFFALSGTALVLVAGLLLPQALFAYQDRIQSNQVLRYETEPFQFQSTSQLSESLLLASTSHSNINLDPAQAQRSEAEIQQFALDAFSLLDECCDGHFASKQFSDFAASPILAVSTSPVAVTDSAVIEGTEQAKTQSAVLAPGTSAIFWDCYLADHDGNFFSLILDDRSGKILSFFYSANIANKALAQGKVEKETISDFYNISSKNLSRFFQKYYQPETLALVEEKPNYIALKLGFSKDDNITLALQFSWDSISFNNYEFF